MCAEIIYFCSLKEMSTEENIQDEKAGGKELRNITHLNGMYENWFLDYASYVILERAIPHLGDGLKPVQRRLLHSMKDLDDGRYNKVANIIGHTMKYHPHGDASIGDALVQLGQKDLLIDTQGNWGNILTGDRAAAPRYIEARLSKFALEVAFLDKITTWKASYDGRNKEPVVLPLKFPLLLAQGVEGIAVGLSSKILPHNFNELIDASIDVLKGVEPDIMPDFLTGGMADASKYSNGMRGGKVRIRARIAKQDAKALIIKEIPFGTTTQSLIDSIVVAIEKGKIKIRKIEDNTAENVEIVLHLFPGISPDITIDALYAFTDCEISVSPNACVIYDDKPRFLSVNEILKFSAKNTVELLKLELTFKKNELEEQLFFDSLVKIFIEKRIYRKIEESETMEAIIDSIDKGLKPYKKLFARDITTDDILRLIEIKIKRISKFDSDKAEKDIQALREHIAEIANHLEHIIDFTIEYFRQLKKKYGKGRERKTELRLFDTIDAAEVIVANQKLYVNREEGFAGTGLSKDEFVADCSNIDDVIVFRENGSFVVSKVSEKSFIGKDVIHIAIFKKNDEKTTYNLIYRDGMNGVIMVKRFSVTGITRDKEYDLTKGEVGSKVLYFTANPNGEAEVLTIHLKPKHKLKKLIFDFDFNELAVKGRQAIGNILSRNAIHKIVVKQEGIATLIAQHIWYDDTIKRLNTEIKGTYIGRFFGEEKIITFMKSGCYKIVGYDLATHFDDDMILIQKFDPKKEYSVVYYDGEHDSHYIKRFMIEPSDKKVGFIGEHPDSKLVAVCTDKSPVIEVCYSKENKKTFLNETIKIVDFIAIKGVKAKGKRISNHKVSKVHILEPDVADVKPVFDMPEPIAKPAEQLAAKQKAVVLKEEEPAGNPNPKDNEVDVEPKQMTLDF